MLLLFVIGADIDKRLPDNLQKLRIYLPVRLRDFLLRHTYILRRNHSMVKLLCVGKYSLIPACTDIFNDFCNAVLVFSVILRTAL